MLGIKFKVYIMDGVGKTKSDGFVSSSMDTKENTPSITTNSGEPRATESEDLPRQFIGKRRAITVLGFNQASDESGSISNVSGAVCTDELSDARSLSLLNLSQSGCSLKKYKKSTEAVSATEISDPEQRDFLSEMCNAIAFENRVEFDEIIATVLNLNTSNKGLTDRAEDIFTKIATSVFRLDPITAVSQYLFFFVRGQKTDLVKAFLKIGADANYYDIRKHVSNLSCASRLGNVEIANLLLKHGADANGHPKNSVDAPLFYAIENGHVPCVELLLVNGADANYSKGIGYNLSPLCLSVYYRNSSIMKLLLKYGADDINRNSPKWWQDPLCCAAFSGNVECVSFLLSKKCRVDGDVTCIRNPLVNAVKKNHTKCAKLLLSEGADASGSRGITPLWAAMNCEYLEFEDHLTPNKRCLSSPKEMAGKINIDLVRLLLFHGADPNSQARWGGANFDRQLRCYKSPLRMATYDDDTVCVDLLFQYGAVIDHSSDPPLLSIALNNKNVDIAMMLMLKGAELKGLNSCVYQGMLKDNGYDNHPPLRLRALCLRSVNSSLHRKSDQERASAIDSCGIPTELKETLSGANKWQFFQC